MSGSIAKPDPLLTVSEWADRYRMLSSRAAAEPGRHRTKRTPYMKEIMDALSPGHPAQRVVFMKAAQVGATEAGNRFLSFIIHQAPGPALAVQPAVELAKRNSRQRIDPLIEESPALRDKVNPARSRGFESTCWNGEIVRGAFVLDAHDREVIAWRATTGVGISGSDICDMMLEAVEARFGGIRAPHPVEWLSDNGSIYTACETASSPPSSTSCPASRRRRAPRATA